MQEELTQVLKQQLRDVHVPEAVSWWPLAPGWWILALIIMGLAGMSIRRAIHKHRQNRYRQTAIAELTRHFQDYQSEHNGLAYLQRANAILKRCVLHLDSNASNARASGDGWISILEQFGGAAFSAETRLALSQSIYQPEESLDIQTIHPQLLDWVSNHHPISTTTDERTQPGASNA